MMWWIEFEYFFQKSMNLVIEIVYVYSWLVITHDVLEQAYSYPL